MKEGDQNYQSAGVLHTLKRAVHSNHSELLPIKGGEFRLLILDLSGKDFEPLVGWGRGCCVVLVVPL